MQTLMRFATFHARPGHGEELAGHPLHAASLVAGLPRCEMWLVDRDQADPETIRVSETWASQEQSDAALNLPGVREHAERVMALRVAPASARELEAGPDGLEVLTFGSHSPGDCEMAAAS